MKQGMPMDHSGIQSGTIMSGKMKEMHDKTGDMSKMMGDMSSMMKQMSDRMKTGVKKTR